MAVAKKQGIDPALEKAISKLLSQVMKDPQATITDKMKVIDRALKLEAIKQKMSDEGYGSGFFESEADAKDEPT